MKKVLAVIIAMVMVFGFVAACNGQQDAPPEQPVATPETLPAEVDDPPADDDPPAVDDPPAAGGGSFGVISWAEGEIPIALVTDYGDIDDESYNQGAWEGVVQFAQANNIPFQYIRPTDRGSTEANLNAISLALAGGAQVIVTPGFLFTESIYEAQAMYPDLHIIVLDTVPAPPGGEGFIAPNTVAVLYAEDQSAFLAGYAAVMDGHRALGYVGGIPGPSLIRFGSGFVQGAEWAAAELGLAPGEVTIRYTYLGTFAPSPEVQTLAASWYADGIELIFAAAGGAGLSVFAAADATPDGLVIGVDVDQAHHSDRIITSALKELRNSVASMLEFFFDGNFPGGDIYMMDATNYGVGLPTGPESFDRFTQFTRAQYDAIFAELLAGNIPVNDSIEDPNPAVFLDLELVDVDFIWAG